MSPSVKRFLDDWPSIIGACLLFYAGIFAIAWLLSWLSIILAWAFAVFWVIVTTCCVITVVADEDELRRDALM